MWSFLLAHPCWNCSSQLSINCPGKNLTHATKEELVGLSLSSKEKPENGCSNSCGILIRTVTHNEENNEFIGIYTGEWLTGSFVQCSCQSRSPSDCKNFTTALPKPIVGAQARGCSLTPLPQQRWDVLRAEQCLVFPFPCLYPTLIFSTS